jgi:hypothetical protein
MFVMSVVFCAVRASRLLIAVPTSCTSVPPTVYVGAVMPPFASTLAPPPNAAAVDAAVLYSCDPFTASVLEVDTAPAATPEILREPAVPATLISLPFVVPPIEMTPVVASWLTYASPPLIMLLIVLLMLVMSDVFWFVFASTANNWAPLTASLLVAVMAPAATPEIVTKPPAVLTSAILSCAGEA